MVVLIRVNDDNYGTKDAFVAESEEAAIKFICKDAEMEEDELKEFEEHAISKNCRVWDIDGEMVYRLHLKPTIL